MATKLTGIEIQSQFLICVEKSILYAKITDSEKNCFITQFVFVVLIMSHILTNEGYNLNTSSYYVQYTYSY